MPRDWSNEGRFASDPNETIGAEAMVVSSPPSSDLSMLGVMNTTSDIAGSKLLEPVASNSPALFAVLAILSMFGAFGGFLIPGFFNAFMVRTNATVALYPAVRL